MVFLKEFLPLFHKIYVVGLWPLLAVLIRGSNKCFYGEIMTVDFEMFAKGVGCVFICKERICGDCRHPSGIWCQNDIISTSMLRDYIASTLIRHHFYVMCRWDASPICKKFKCKVVQTSEKTK